MMLWWAFFGGVSVSWALGSPWLVDTVLQGEGLRLAQERPTWFVVVVLVSGLVKLVSSSSGSPSCARTSSGCRAGCAWPSAGCRGSCSWPTGLAGSASAVPRLLAGEPLSRYGWWRLLLWMPSLLGGRHPGAGRDGRLPALEPAHVDRFCRARGPCWALIPRASVHGADIKPPTSSG